MYFKKLFILFLIISIISSVSFVSAADNETTQEAITQTNENDMIEINDDNIDLENTENQELLSENNDSRVIYVGQNKTTDGGNGTPDNPFESFELACNNLSGEKKVEINVYNGTYYLNSNLKFNTSNLFITGIGEVIIKNLENKDGCFASFGLTSPYGNFTFSNLIFDGSNCAYDINNLNLNRYFYAFKGKANLGILYNCTFTGFDRSIIFFNQFNRKFIYSNFIDTYNYICRDYWYDGLIIDFEYCIFSNDVYWGEMSLTRNARVNLTYNNVWLGTNRIDEYLSYDAVSSTGSIIKANTNLIRYAIFSASENYLGNNTYEIIGKLVWNDSTTDGIELLNPMTVEISSRTGNVEKRAILENGTFKVIYKSNSEDNVIEIGLDSQEVILEFKNGVQVVANPIYVGDKQIITINLPQTNCIVNITVNNNNYEVQSNASSTFNFTVPDELLAGNYQVNVSIMDSVNHVYGFDSANWTISKNKQNILITTPANININDKSVNLTILLEKDATGNITVINNDKNITQEVLGRTVQIDISSLLNIGENEIKVIYSGNKKYLNQTKSYKIFVNKAYPNINITKPINPIIDSKINITISLPLNASGNLTIIVGNKNLTINNTSDKNTVDISDLVTSGYNLVTVKYSGDELWDSQIKKETIYVNKKTPEMSVNITQSAVLIGENITIQINLPQDAKGNITVNENYLFNVSSMTTEINIPSSISGINNINITYSGSDKYYPQSQIIQITVERLNISSNEMKITISYPNFSIELPKNITGNVTVTINGKKHVQSLIEGKTSLKINDLPSGKYDAIVTYNGDNKFNQITKSIEFKVPKPTLKANDLTVLYTSNSKYIVQVTVGGSPVIGKTVTFTINGKQITAVTDNNGYASVKIVLPPKSNKYTVTCEYQGVKITNKVKVNSIIQAKNLKIKKSAKTLKIKVALKKVNGKYLKGKKITLKFKGKKYITKTNKKGVAVFKLNKKVLNKLKVGKKYNYEVIYLKDSVSKKISVKK